MSIKRHHSYRRHKKENGFILSVLLILLAAVFLVMAGISVVREREEMTGTDTAQTQEADDQAFTDGEEEAKEKETGEDDGESAGTQAPSWTVPALNETDIYTFTQGPLAWESKTDWGGSWCHEILWGQYFSVFGCGLCDLANIYSTLTPYNCSPLDMYYFAQEVSGYAPTYGVGAIDWPYMQQTLAATGIESELRLKDPDYADFQEIMSRSVTAIALIGSAADATYWQGVDGHYVNIWLYNPEDDTVFLADSGNPAHNRQRIPLRYVYDAMLTYSSSQYLLVTSVDEDANSWKHDGINEDWNRPDYI